MKDNNLPIHDLSYYGLYLQRYLKEYHPDQVGGSEFIQVRADYASDIFEQSRLHGFSVSGAHELAMAELMKGLHFSKYHLIRDILSEEFSKAVPEEKFDELIVQLGVRLNAIFAKYDLSDDFEQTAAYDTLYTEVTGEIALYLENRGKYLYFIGIFRLYRSDKGRSLR